jgi:hypothetical protein
VASPRASSFFAVLGPTPHSRRAGSGPSISATRSGGTTTRSSGLSRSLASFATSFDGPTPADPLLAELRAGRRELGGFRGPGVDGGGLAFGGHVSEAVGVAEGQIVEAQAGRRSPPHWVIALMIREIEGHAVDHADADALIARGPTGQAGGGIIARRLGLAGVGEEHRPPGSGASKPVRSTTCACAGRPRRKGCSGIHSEPGTSGS